MPQFVATIEAWFVADSLDEAGDFADSLGDAISDFDGAGDLRISGITSGASPVAEAE